MNVSRGMKQRKKIAIVALARKLLVRLWAMLRDGSNWRDPDQHEDARCARGGCGVSPPEDTGRVNWTVSSAEVAMG